MMEIDKIVENYDLLSESLRRTVEQTQEKLAHTEKLIKDMEHVHSSSSNSEYTSPQVEVIVDTGDTIPENQQLEDPVTFF